MITGYTEQEVCQLYKESKDKESQIGILAELTDTNTEEIKQILVANGHSVKRPPLSLSEWKGIIEMKLAGEDITTIADKYGVSKDTIQNRWRSQARNLGIDLSKVDIPRKKYETGKKTDKENSVIKPVDKSIASKPSGFRAAVMGVIDAYEAAAKACKSLGECNIEFSEGVFSVTMSFALGNDVK